MTDLHLHTMAATTHTVELEQIDDINTRLASHPPVTAADLGTALSHVSRRRLGGG